MKNMFAGCPLSGTEEVLEKAIKTYFVGCFASIEEAMKSREKLDMVMAWVAKRGQP